MQNESSTNTLLSITNPVSTKILALELFIAQNVLDNSYCKFFKV